MVKSNFNILHRFDEEGNLLRTIEERSYNVFELKFLLQVPNKEKYIPQMKGRDYSEHRDGHQ